ncbi:uncharacterized protein N0V89_006535 [Didymosphaeria variabile]|uniref:Uncharacterized protein n=1 Tax=Didymosphaeria variabile TaxID=1932322 RepID=A0A9W8XIC6_9PLEO|nr:uncharacterized protein N0V89_006535 [Didymosphaeria variabile]KAJ4351196.1 hypothetical protein N0V89_006535 [Didymosphaeria variabile]
MTLPRLYEEVTLRTYAELRYVNGRPTGYGSGSPFAMGLNTLVSRAFADYVQTFRVIGEWREHDVDDYSKGRVPDNSMVLQVAMRAAMDKMKNLKTFAWELNTKPLQTVYEGLMQKSSLTSLILRFPSRRIPRPTVVVPPLPNLMSLICYDIDPLASPDNISLLLLTSKKLQNLKLHFNPRMRETGEESVQLNAYFGRCIAAGYSIVLKRFALYNLYCRNQGEGFEKATNPASIEEVTIINSMGSSDPMTVFLDDTWRLSPNQPIPTNLKMLRVDSVEPEQVPMLTKFQGLERFYIVSKPFSSKTTSTAQTPTSPSSNTTPNMNTNGHSACSTSTPRPITEGECKSVAGDYLAAIQSNHRTMRHLLLSDHWNLSDDALFKICQTLPHLEQLGFACFVPPMESLRQILSHTPKLWAIRMLVPPGSPFQARLDAMDIEMHQFALATEMWRPQYRQLKYVGMGNKAFKLGDVVWPKGKSKARAEEEAQHSSAFGGRGTSINDLRNGPIRRLELVDPKSLNWIEIWGMDSTEFEAKFP